jgi:hypothetical protein
MMTTGSGKRISDRQEKMTDMPTLSMGSVRISFIAVCNAVISLGFRVRVRVREGFPSLWD